MVKSLTVYKPSETKKTNRREGNFFLCPLCGKGYLQPLIGEQCYFCHAYVEDIEGGIDEKR